MPNQGPISDPVELVYTGPTRANAFPGPVSGNGYPTHDKVQPVEKVDVEALLATGFWKKPPRQMKRKEVKDATQ